jgi:UDP-4-amino-4,6-dideoxy-N-acetyl-beta-L-altrosamine transaminase
MTAPRQFLPYTRQSVDDDDILAVSGVLRSEYLTSGPVTADFEESLARNTGAAFASSCSSGTAALHLAMLAAGIGAGQRVIVPTVTFLATANAARYVGGDVVFADVDPDTGLLTGDTFLQALDRANGDVAAVVPVHLAGQSPDMAVIGQIAARHGLKIIEDACHALGATNNLAGKTSQVGDCAYSDMAIFSFHPAKTVSMGEGGAVTTNNEDYYRRLCLYRNHGMTREPESFLVPDQAVGDDGTANPWYYEMAEPGYNYRASDIHCALGLSQLKKLSKFVEKRRLLAARYESRLAGLAPRLKVLDRVPHCNPAWHLFVVLLDFEHFATTRADLMNNLRSREIGTQVHYIPVHRQPYYRRIEPDLSLLGADEYYRRCLSLPLFAAMEESDVDYVVDQLLEVLG